MSEPAGLTVSFTEAQGFAAVGSFLQAICAPAPLTVIRAIGATAPGQNSRVPEPIVGDFIVMSSLMQKRLETNETSFQDNVIVASISGTTLTVASVTRGVVPIGALLSDTASSVSANTIIAVQLTGSPGASGTYQVSISQTVASETMYAGVRSDLAGTEWTIQLDVHGPNSMNNARVIDTLLRSEYATDFFAGLGVPVMPLYCDDAHQLPFENAEQQIEFRWVIDAHFEVGVTVGTPQQFADAVSVETIEAAVIYTG